jgi:hypothetical protein
MNMLQIFYVADNGLLINVENRHQIRAQVCDVQSAAVAVEALVIKTSRAATHRDIRQHAQRQIAWGSFGF